MNLTELAKNIEPESRGSRFREHAPEVIALDVAENLLLVDELAELIAQPPLILGRSDFNYPHNSVGPDEVRDAIAALLSETWNLRGEHGLTGEQVLCTPGASAALHMHARARLQPGDSIIIPSPYWQMFDRIYHQSGVQIEVLPASVNAGTSVDLVQLQTIHAKMLAVGRAPRMLLITNPHNPLGIVETRQSLETLFDWVLEYTSMEIVSDEIYAHSIFDSEATFTSALALDSSLKYCNRVHTVWGFAKDFGLSGWMAGVLLTRSQSLADEIIHQYARFSPFDGLKGRVFRRLLCEQADGDASPQRLLRMLPERLAAAREVVATTLQQQAIPYRRAAQGAPFFWLDLRRYLDADLVHAPHPAACILDGPESRDHDPREGHLQRFLACNAGVVLLRGQTMHCDSPGYFRLCFTAEPSERVVLAVRRIGQVLSDLSVD